jgi:hypothetical protein
VRFLAYIKNINGMKIKDEEARGLIGDLKDLDKEVDGATLVDAIIKAAKTGSSQIPIQFIDPDSNWNNVDKEYDDIVEGVDLSGYYKKTEVDNLLSKKANNSDNPAYEFRVQMISDGNARVEQTTSGNKIIVTYYIPVGTIAPEPEEPEPEEPEPEVPTPDPEPDPEPDPDPEPEEPTPDPEPIIEQMYYGVLPFSSDYSFDENLTLDIISNNSTVFNETDPSAVELTITTTARGDFIYVILPQSSNLKVYWVDAMTREEILMSSANLGTIAFDRKDLINKFDGVDCFIAGSNTRTIGEYIIKIK